MHYVLNTPNDRIVWDVGHQAYGHKILTGRKELFHTNRKLNGISGFPNPLENDYDTFIAGHASNSISAALGMDMAAAFKKEQRVVVAVIGDGAMTRFCLRRPEQCICLPKQPAYHLKRQPIRHR